jgi:putative flippase GtrA
MNVAVLIPALRPGPELIAVLRELLAAGLRRLVIVDDGSGGAWKPLFDECVRQYGAEVLRHTSNLGKGAALKTGFRHILAQHPDCAGVVTADADGQHLPDDILRVASQLCAQPETLILGSRTFGGGVPWRSRLGNLVTRRLVRILVGQTLLDTQTGLRGIPRSLLPHLLDIHSSGYEFELDMLIAARHRNLPILEIPIRTVYNDGNAASHFNPLFDSMRIYFVLLRFTAVSLLTAGLDNAVFSLAFGATGAVARSQIASRAAAVLFHYQAARRAVFLSQERHSALLPKYLLLVLASGLASYALIGFLRAALGWPVLVAKITAESILFPANFLLQRDVIFRRRLEPAATDWDRYYRSAPFTAHWTRRYTRRVLARLLRRFAASGAGAVAELGGANSCFLESVMNTLQPAVYHVVDSNGYGLELLRRRTNGDARVRLHQHDILAQPAGFEADVVFSVGLIEHFDQAGTRQAIDAHFRALKPGGIALISFPEPTWLYRAARWVAEALSVWRFPDERPLDPAEVRRALPANAELLHEETLWPLVFTQRFIVVRKAHTAS